jgi:hypothetical protein
MKLAVLNADGRDPEQAFPDYAGAPGAGGHPPVNFHAFAACTAGTFHRKVTAIGDDQKYVLLLLRADLKPCLRALEELKARGKIVAITWKETGGHQIAQQLNDPVNIQRFRTICASAHGALATTPESILVYRSAGAKNVEYIPTPYPVEHHAWDFSMPIASRRGVLIGTREWGVPSRNHLTALMTSALFEQPVTVFNCDGRAGRKKLDALAHPRLDIIDKKLPYTEYLRVIARHRIVWQLDSSRVPGQVAGDAAMCRVPCIGGNGAIDREVFPMLAGYGREIGDLMQTAERLLRDDRAYDSEIKVDASLARERVCFSVITERLLKFFQSLG